MRELARARRKQSQQLWEAYYRILLSAADHLQ
jgi:hypothetical protein